MSAVAMETMNQGHTLHSQTCEGLSGLLLCQREGDASPYSGGGRGRVEGKGGACVEGRGRVEGGAGRRGRGMVGRRQ